MGHRYLPATKKMTSNMYFLKASIMQSMSMIEKVPLWKKIIKTKKMFPNGQMTLQDPFTNRQCNCLHPGELFRILVLTGSVTVSYLVEDCIGSQDRVTVSFLPSSLRTLQDLCTNRQGNWILPDGGLYRILVLTGRVTVSHLEEDSL